MTTTSALKLGMDSEAIPSDAQATVYEFPQQQHPATVSADSKADSSTDMNLDHFIRRDGKCYAGTHLIIDLWGGSGYDDIDLMRATLRRAVDAAGATLLHLHLHHFTPNGGVSGVAVLAESHISVHSWPEADYAAFDVFMCGDSEPHKAVDVLRAAFSPSEVTVSEYLRGETEAPPER